MVDPRVVKLANLLVDYSIRLKRGDVILIRGQAVAAPLIRECYRSAVRRGAHVETNVGVEGLTEIFYKEASDDQLRWVSPFARQRMRRIDAYIGIWGDQNTRSLTNVDPKRTAMAGAAQKPIEKVFLRRSAAGELRWVGTQWPTHASAQDADMSLSEYADFVFSAGRLDEPDPAAFWREVSREQRAMVASLNRAKEIRIVAPDTDLTFATRGRKWINCDGRLNFPDGEVFTGPVESSANGHIRFSFPAIHGGREVLEPALEFKGGRVVRAEAAKGQDFLQAMIAMDRGSGRIGEVAFGTNYGIPRFTRNTLFDEKIGGTFHLAVGAGYPETGSTNESGLHWDMICDLRRGGRVSADGELIFKDGRFLDERFPQPVGPAPRRKALKQSRK